MQQKITEYNVERFSKPNFMDMSNISGSVAPQSTLVDPMFQGKLVVTKTGTEKEKQALQQRYSNISAIRKTSISQFGQSEYSKSLIGGGDKPFKSLEHFLDEMFSKQFVTFTNRIKNLTKLSFEELANNEEFQSRVLKN